MQQFGFNAAVLFVVTAAFYFMVFILPKQAKANQQIALYCFQYSFIMPFLAFIAFVLRFSGYDALSVLLTNLFLLSAMYLFYFGIRARFACLPSWLNVVAATLHIVLFAAAQWLTFFLEMPSWTRDINSFFNLSLPLWLTIVFIHQHPRRSNYGDRVVKLALVSIWLVLTLVLPTYIVLNKPDSNELTNIATLVAMVLECLLFCGVAISYIYDLVEKLKNDAYTDKLTGLRNRRFFNRITSGVFSSAQRYGFSTCVILADIDDFKQLNDTHGHMSGDEAIRSVADALKMLLREEDILIRFGGEEFLALLPNTDFNTALKVAERMRHAVERMSNPEIPNQITLSLGVSQVKDLDDLESSIQRADAAMYDAKQRGKNQVARDKGVIAEVAT
ncbi:GGDEF domain-containing protein [Lacimicrobium sp. SS2-24]|uniref:GGDEF domain-containing protein n=1 Tax=Lacimicrobium sp. SS2-24 TaxID=2005569 RepID=UPI000B4AF6FF|nr:GGDEF domain-containing protein [Lacimicrobium sp. SS2-24]